MNIKVDMLQKDSVPTVAFRSLSEQRMNIFFYKNPNILEGDEHTVTPCEIKKSKARNYCSANFCLILKDRQKNKTRNIFENTKCNIASLTDDLV